MMLPLLIRLLVQLLIHCGVGLTPRRGLARGARLVISLGLLLQMVIVSEELEPGVDQVGLREQLGTEVILGTRLVRDARGAGIVRPAACEFRANAVKERSVVKLLSRPLASSQERSGDLGAVVVDLGRRAGLGHGQGWWRRDELPAVPLGQGDGRGQGLVGLGVAAVHQCTELPRHATRKGPADEVLPTARLRQ